MKSIDKKSFLRLLSQRRNVAIVPGGIAEMFYAGRENEEVLHVLNRKGFVKIALSAGAQIIPTYTFGQSQILKVLNRV